MELFELYDQIQNPLDDPKIINKLIEIYADDTPKPGGFYGKLTDTVEKKYNGEHYYTDADKFHAMMFNKWKKNVSAMTRDEFIELYKQGYCDKDFIKMREYLLDTPYVNTREEANAILFANDNKEILGTFQKYAWNALGQGSGWQHVCSKYVSAMKDEYFEIEHRLYLNSESMDTYKMVTLLVEKMEQHNVPYYFKFSLIGKRDDNIVLYSNSENLPKYIEILEEIKKENPTLVAEFKSPPLLTGKINDWIGYGSEPLRTPVGHPQSFNYIRSKAIQKSLEDATNQWVFNNKDLKIKIQEKEITLKEYVAMIATEQILKDLRNKASTMTDSGALELLGYSLEDTKTPIFKQTIFNILNSRIDECLTMLCTGNKFMRDIEMGVRYGKRVSFTNEQLNKSTAQLAQIISTKDKTFATSVKNEIIKNSAQYGIDTTKYCFDVHIREKIKSINTNSTYEQLKPIYDTNVNKTEVPKDITPPKQVTPSNLEKVWASDLVNLINPTLLNQNVKLPSGSIISTKEYIEELVFPYLPANGKVILKNGSAIGTKQFIEEFVLQECLTKYNGDFCKYYAENTRNNQNTVYIQDNGNYYEIRPNEIVDFINPTLLESRITLPNGIAINAKQYIQEIYSPYIPTNGTITLADGTSISVLHYIQNFLLWYLENRCNGDIVKALNYTTNANNGYIDITGNKDKQELAELKSLAKVSSNSPYSANTMTQGNNGIKR